MHLAFCHMAVPVIRPFLSKAPISAIDITRVRLRNSQGLVSEACSLSSALMRPRKNSTDNKTPFSDFQLFHRCDFPILPRNFLSSFVSPSKGRCSSLYRTLKCPTKKWGETALNCNISTGHQGTVVEKHVEHAHAGFVVVNFYHLTNIRDPLAEVAKHHEFIKGSDIKGRIYISEQGLNAQFSGPGEEALRYANWVAEQPEFEGMFLQVSPSTAGHAFPRLKLRYKPSLVQVEGGTAVLPLTDAAMRAIPLSPKEWREKLEGEGRRILLLDVRNGYEWDVGHFGTAARPAVENFRDTDFGMEPSATPESDPLGGVDRDTTDVMMYCTGGIRCDVYSTLLRERGFKHLYTLQGGVARYLEEEGGEHWVGNLFVFDSRLSVPGPHFQVGERVRRGEIGFEEGAVLAREEGEVGDVAPSACCVMCGGEMGVARHRNCANMDCNELYLCCLSCARELQGCCCANCMSAVRVRPFSEDPHPFAKWHTYRPLEPKRPVGVLTGRALRRLERRKCRERDSSCEEGQ